VIGRKKAQGIRREGRKKQNKEKKGRYTEMEIELK
jgi:hypothetical protein